MDEERFIPGIYNYCDRWCERCSMTSRCRLYADEQLEIMLLLDRLRRRTEAQFPKAREFRRPGFDE